MCVAQSKLPHCTYKSKLCKTIFHLILGLYKVIGTAGYILLELYTESLTFQTHIFTVRFGKRELFDTSRRAIHETQATFAYFKFHWV